MLGKRSKECTPAIRWKSAYSSTSVANGPLPDSLRLGEDREKARSCNLLRLWHLTIPSLLPANKNDQPLDGAVIMPPRSAGHAALCKSLPPAGPGVHDKK